MNKEDSIFLENIHQNIRNILNEDSKDIKDVKDVYDIFNRIKYSCISCSELIEKCKGDRVKRRKIIDYIKINIINYLSLFQNKYQMYIGNTKYYETILEIDDLIDYILLEYDFLVEPR